MSRKTKPVLCLVIMIALLFTMGACATTTTTPNATTAPISTTSGTPATSGQTTAAPIKFEKPKTMTYWCPMDTRIAKFGATLAESPVFKELKNRLGVDITFTHPPQGMDRDQFKVLVASKNLPDVIEYDWFAQYPGGPARAIKDGVIRDLTPYFVPDIAPNILKLLDKFDAEYELTRSIKTIDGQFYVFPCIRGEGLLKQINNGMMVREDWLTEMGIKIPVTIDDWYSMLTRFKNEKGCTSPLSFRIGFFKDGQGFAGAFGVGHDFYIDTKGVIQYGPAMPDYKKFYEVMAKWYAEGLIEPDFSTINDDGVLQRMTSSKAGACIGQNDSTMGIILNAMKNDPKFDLVGCPHPKVNATDPDLRIFKRDQFYTTSGSAAITTDCDNPEGVAWVLDYWYGEEGHMLGNFGIKGESYTTNPDGSFKGFTDLVMKNPAGNSFKEMIIWYSRAAGSAPLLRDVAVVDQQRFDTRIVDATNTWAKVLDRSAIVPRLSFTAEENTRISKLMVDITTYNDQMFLKFIMGREPVSNFEKSVAEIKRMGIDEVLTIYNMAYKRFKAN